MTRWPIPCAHRLGDFLFNECATAGQLAAKRVGRHVDRIPLPADHAVRAKIEIKRDRKAGPARRPGRNPTIAAAYAHRLAHNDLPHGSTLLDNAGRVDGLDELTGRAVAPRHFLCVDPNLAVVDAQPSQGRQDVLNHVDADAAEFQ